MTMSSDFDPEGPFDSFHEAYEGSGHTGYPISGPAVYCDDLPNLFAPIHEIGHILAGKMTGVTTWMRGRATTWAEGSISLFFVTFGETFEVIVFALVAVFACGRRRYSFGVFMWSLMFVNLVVIPMQDDYDFMEK